MPNPFVAGPAEILHRLGRVDAVDLFPRVVADVADPDLGRPGPRRDAKRISKSVRDDSPGIRVGIARERIVRQSGARGRIDSDHGSVEADRVAGRSEVLRAQGAAFGGRRGLNTPTPTGGSPPGFFGLPAWP